VGDAKQQQKQGELHARVPLFNSSTNQEAAQEGGLKGWIADKQTPVGGSPLALARPQWM